VQRQRRHHRPAARALRNGQRSAARPCRGTRWWVTVSKKSQVSRASAWERRKPAHVVELRSGAGGDPGVVQDLLDGGSGDLYPENQQLAVCPAIPTSGILADQSQQQDANRAHGARPTRVPPATPDQPGGTALCSDRAAAARPRVGGAARGSPRLCPGCSSAAARTRSPHRGRPVAAARSITMPQQSPVARAPHRPPSRTNIGLTHASVPSSMEEVLAGAGPAVPTGKNSSGSMPRHAARSHQFMSSRSRPRRPLAPV
jgi:hypothetical protein